MKMAMNNHVPQNERNFCLAEELLNSQECIFCMGVNYVSVF